MDGRLRDVRIWSTFNQPPTSGCDARREAAYIALSRRFNNDPPGVPLVVIGDEAFVGYRDDATIGAELERRIRACLAAPCIDVAGPILAEAGARLLVEVRRGEPGRRGLASTHRLTHSHGIRRSNCSAASASSGVAGYSA